MLSILTKAKSYVTFSPTSKDLWYQSKICAQMQLQLLIKLYWKSRYLLFTFKTGNCIDVCRDKENSTKNRQKLGIRDRLRFKQKKSPQHQEKNYFKTLDTENKA